MTESKLYSVYLPYPEKGDRLVRIYVPAHSDGELLPVIYMTDGQNLFDEESSTWGCWHTMEAVEYEREHGLGGAVIVGIDNSNLWRDNELTPASIGKIIGPQEMENFTRPEGETFDRFVTQTVMPYVEQNYPVKKGRTFTAFCGSSSGGLQSFFEALEHSELFSAAGVFSPAFLLYSEEDMRAWIMSRLKNEMPYLYIYTGCGDELEQKIFAGVESAYDSLLESGYPPEQLNEVIMLEYPHHEKAWAEIFRDFLHTFLSKIK